MERKLRVTFILVILIAFVCSVLSLMILRQSQSVNTVEDTLDMYYRTESYLQYVVNYQIYGNQISNTLRDKHKSQYFLSLLRLGLIQNIINQFEIRQIQSYFSAYENADIDYWLDLIEATRVRLSPYQFKNIEDTQKYFFIAKRQHILSIDELLEFVKYFQNTPIASYFDSLIRLADEYNNRNFSDEIFEQIKNLRIPEDYKLLNNEIRIMQDSVAQLNNRNLTDVYMQIWALFLNLNYCFLLNIEDIENTFDQSFLKDNNQNVLWFKASCYYQKQDYDKALELLRKLIDLDPLQIEYRYLYLDILKLINADRENLFNVIDQIFMLNPQDYELYTTKISILINDNIYEETKSYILKFLKNSKILNKTKEMALQRIFYIDYEITRFMCLENLIKTYLDATEIFLCDLMSDKKSRYNDEKLDRLSLLMERKLYYSDIAQQTAREIGKEFFITYLNVVLEKSQEI
ncbi:MAG: tetratricopeptide repeat protein [Candidatus Dojkabacteria bacterium]|nr:tetratricopeptide repeat protein [Candidatus Dojkabacteria bacterium]